MPGECDDAPDDRIVRIEAGFANAIAMDGSAVPPCEYTGQPIELGEIESERATDIPHRAFRTVSDQCRRKCCAIAAVFPVDILHHVFASLVLEIDIDVRRLVALLADEALEQHLHARRVDFGDVERVANSRIGRRSASLAQDVFRARERDDVLHRQEIGLVPEFGNERQLVLDERTHVRRYCRAAKGAVAVEKSGSEMYFRARSVNGK